MPNDESAKITNYVEIFGGRNTKNCVRLCGKRIALYGEISAGSDEIRILNSRSKKKHFK